MAPKVAEAVENLVPVHINVGGTTYTTCLDTLTRFPNSKIAQLFDGSLPIGVDPNPIQQQYFLDRDGQIFRHVLNYLRYSKLVLPNNFTELDLLMEEARYYEIEDLCRAVKKIQSDIRSNDEAELNEDDISVQNYVEKPKKCQRKKRSKKTENKDHVKGTLVDEELANINGRSQGKKKNGDLGDGNTLLENLPFQGELIIVETDYYGVVSLRCSDEHFEIRLPTSPPLLQLVQVNRSRGHLCREFTFTANIACKNCSNVPEPYYDTYYQAYITKEGHHTCNNCNPSYNPTLCTFECDLKDATIYDSNVQVEFPWVAKYLMRRGYKLATSAAVASWARSEIIYHHFVK